MSYSKEYYEQNKEQVKEVNRRWREAHPDYAHNWYMENKESLLVNGREWRDGNRDRVDYLNKRNYRLNGDSIRASVKEWAEDNPEKVVAQNTLKTQIRNGNIVRPNTCSFCGDVSVVAGHHEDYTKPLEVEWLCRSCHKRVHAGTLR